MREEEHQGGFEGSSDEGQRIVNCQLVLLKAIYCHFSYLTYMQSTLCEMPAWMTQAGFKIAQRIINNLSYADNTTLMPNAKRN